MPGFRVRRHGSGRVRADRSTRSDAYADAAALSEDGQPVEVDDDDGTAARFEDGKLAWERPLQVVCGVCGTRRSVTTGTAFCRTCGTQVA